MLGCAPAAERAVGDGLLLVVVVFVLAWGRDLLRVWRANEGGHGTFQQTTRRKKTQHL